MKKHKFLPTLLVLLLLSSSVAIADVYNSIHNSDNMQRTMEDGVSTKHIYKTAITNAANLTAVLVTAGESDKVTGLEFYCDQPVLVGTEGSTFADVDQLTPNVGQVVWANMAKHINWDKNSIDLRARTAANATCDINIEYWTVNN